MTRSSVRLQRPSVAARTASRTTCAIDRPDIEGTLALARALVPHVGGIKLGLEFFAAQGPRGVEAVAALGLPVFLDLKLHDIPNTVGKAVEAIAHLEPAILTVHAAGGRAMMAQSISPLAIIWLSDLSATRVSFTPFGRRSSTFSSRPGSFTPACTQ